MQFPELTTWANNAVALIQFAGGVLVAVCVAIIAVMILTSFGNTQRLVTARTAGICLAVGIFLLLAAPKLATVLENLAGGLQK
jgi:hypothetical protein